MSKRKTKNSKRKSKSKHKNYTESFLPRLEGPTNCSNPLKVKSEKTSKLETVLPGLHINRPKRRKRDKGGHHNDHDIKRGAAVCLPKVDQNQNKKCGSCNESSFHGKTHNSSKMSLAKPKVTEAPKQLNAMSGNAEQNCVKESLYTIGNRGISHQETNNGLWKIDGKELENQESGWKKVDHGIHPEVDGADFPEVLQTVDQTPLEGDGSFIARLDNKKNPQTKKNCKDEILTPGPEKSKESGASESAKNTNDTYEHDLIFEEIVESGSIKFHPKNHRELRPRHKPKTRNLPKLKNLESGSKYHRDRGNVLFTTEFKVQGLEVGLKDKKTKDVCIAAKKFKNMTVTHRKPNISLHKNIKDGDGIHGSKVVGNAVDVDECVIAMVRLYNCNDAVKQDGLQEFPSQLCQGFFWTG